MKNGVYAILNIEKLKVYIGESCNATLRIRKHKSMLRGNYHFCESLQKDWNESTEKSFIFQFIDCNSSYSEKDRIEKEKYWIDYYKKNTKFDVYNTRSEKYLVAEQTRLKLSLAHKGLQAREKHPMWGKEGYWKGKHKPEEFKKKVSETLKGHPVSDESRKKMSESHKGKSPKHKFQTTDEVINDIRNGISYKDFTKKYGVTVNVIIRIKRELRESGIITV